MKLTYIITFNLQYSYPDFTNVNTKALERVLLNSSIVSKAREVKEFVQSHTTRKWQNQDLNLGSPTYKSLLFLLR